MSAEPRRRVALVTIVIDDYDEAIAHYVDDLGFELVEDTPQSGKRWVVVRPLGSPPEGAEVLLGRAADDRQRARIGDQTGGRVGFFLHTDDFARDHTRMVAAGIRFLEPPRRESYGTVAQFEDRYGNRWDLLEPTD